MTFAHFKSHSLPPFLIFIYLIRSIALHAESGLMYWSTWSQYYAGVIEYAYMDGTHKRTLVDASERMISMPSSLTIDYGTKKLYWCDPRTSLIERIGLDGKDREVLIQKTTDENFMPSTMAYHNKYIFWSDNIMGNITRMHIESMDQQKQIVVLANETYRVTDIKVFDNTLQSAATNRCAEFTCVGISLSTPNGCVCKCGNGFTLNGSGNTCIPHKISPNCSAGSFACKLDGTCVSMDAVCDGLNDCSDGSDESAAADGPCNCARFGEQAFECQPNVCIEISRVCDGIRQCANGHDEKRCNSGKTCAADRFQCRESLECIPTSWVCDHNKDCADGSDEKSCSECAEFSCANGNCVSMDELCNGENNCGDHSDELQCQLECGPDDHYCLPKCVSRAQICDGIIDCSDTSDEANCSRNATTKDLAAMQCAEHEFLCHNLAECVIAEARCDGFNDCRDRSDEIDCTTIRPRPTVYMNESQDCFHPDRICRISGHCVPVYQLCDGRTDCSDGSDEGYRCDEKVCDHNSECSHYCNNSPEGFVCSCPLHMFLKPNGLQCSTEHACDHWGTCSQICEQQGKHYKCKCYDGYTLQYDDFTCKSNNADAPYVIFSNREEIRGIDLHTLAVKNFFASLRNTIALDFLFNNGHLQIYWTDVIDDKIYRGTLIGGVLRNVEAVVQSGLLTAEGLAVDWIGQNLYWLDSNLDQIEVANVNGSFRRTLIAGDLSSPRAIALDPREGLLFWTDWDTNDPRVERCSMAGDFRKTIVHVRIFTSEN